MPRRLEPDPLAERVGRRIRTLRLAAGLTLEKLAYESDLGSKGHLSDIERGLVRPNVQTLKVLADHLGVALLDLVTFPDEDERQRLVDLTRLLPPPLLRRLSVLAEPPRRTTQREKVAQLAETAKAAEPTPPYGKPKGPGRKR